MIPVAVFAVCAIAGWLAARTPAPQGAGDSSAGTKATKTDRAPGKAGPPSEVLAMLAPVRAAKDTEERLRTTIQLASNIPLADIEKWLKAGWFDGTEDMQASLFTRTLLSRWQKEDPAAMLAFCLRKEMRITYEFAGEWARRDPAAALTCIEKETDPRLRNSMLGYMGEALTKADPAIAASRIGDIFSAIGPDGLYQVSGMIRGLASSSPELLKAEAAKWPKALQDVAWNAMTSAALKKNFASGIAGLSRQEDGKRLFMTAVESDSELMKCVGRDPASLPPGWLGALLSGGGSSAYYMIQDDPMKWLELDMDFTALGLDARGSKNIRTYALNHLASKDRAKLESLIAAGQLDDQEHKYAIGALASHMKKTEAEAWMAGLSESDRQIVQAQLSARAQHEERAVSPTDFLSALAEENRQITWGEARSAGNWGREQVQALRAEFAALPEEQKAQVAGKFIANRYVEFPVEFTAEALGYLIANPASASKGEQAPEMGGNQRHDPLSAAACNLASRWGIQDPSAAGDWVKGLPAGEVRTWAARNLVVQWAEYDPTAARRWIASMPAGEREGMEKAIKNRGAN